MILFLAPQDEIRPLYENALRSEVGRLVWFASLESLLSFEPSVQPNALVIDLDTINQAPEWSISQVRARFGGINMVVISSNDSSQLALQCIRAGCADFLLKPISPEELAWSLRTLAQKEEFLKQITSEESTHIRAVNQISSANTLTLVQIYTLEYLKSVFSAMTASWINADPEKTEKLALTCSIPREANSAEILFSFPSTRGVREDFVIKSKTTGSRRIFMPTRSHGGVFLTGVPERPKKRKLETARLIVEHTEVCISNLKKFEDVKQQTFIDDLTGLYNSRYLKFSLANTIARCQSQHSHFSVLFIDVDHFKKINDTHGHLIGSDFLIAIAGAIRRTVRNIDLVFRYGGDEFVIILHQTHVSGAQEIAERIRRHIERRIFTIQGTRIQTTVTIGLATYPDHASDKDELIRLADEAMYSAKRMSRNAVHLAGQ